MKRRQHLLDEGDGYLDNAVITGGFQGYIPGFLLFNFSAIYRSAQITTWRPWRHHGGQYSVLRIGIDSESSAMRSSTITRRLKTLLFSAFSSVDMPLYSALYTFFGLGANVKPKYLQRVDSLSRF